MSTAMNNCSDARNIKNLKSSNEYNADILLASPTLTQRENIFMSEVRQSTWVKANILEFEQRSDGWWETNYGRVIRTNRIWASALRSTPLRTEWWSVQRPDDMSPCRQTPPLIIPLRKCFSFCIPQSSFTFITSLVLSLFLSLSLMALFSCSPLCVASHASGCWIIDGMLS